MKDEAEGRGVSFMCLKGTNFKHTKKERERKAEESTAEHYVI